MIRALQIERDYESYLRGSISIQTTDRNVVVYRVGTLLNQKMSKGPKIGPRITAKVDRVQSISVERVFISTMIELSPANKMIDSKKSVDDASAIWSTFFSTLWYS